MAIKYPEVRGKDVLRAFWQAMKYSLPSLILILLGIIISCGAGIITPLFYRKFIDILISSQPDPAAAIPSLISILWVIFAWGAISWIGYRMAGFMSIRNQARVMARIKQNAYEYILKHSYGFFADNFAGSITQRIGRMARAYERISDRFFWSILPLAIQLIGIAFILWQINPAFTWILLVWVAAFSAIQYGISLYRLPYDVKAAEEDSKVTGYLADTISNQNAVQLFNGFEREYSGFWKRNSSQADLTIRSWNIGEFSTAIQSASIVIVEFLVFYFAVHSWAEGAITVGTFTLIQMYFLGIGDKLWSISGVVRDLYQSYADSKEMLEMLLLPHEVKDIPLAKPLPESVSGEIAFEHATFGFSEAREVLSDFSLKIRAGEKVALIGPSGAGKSTFVRLLLRLYNLASGKITIDGQDIAESTLESLRKNIAFVPQDPVLFHRSLMENIRYGREDATNEEVVRAAKLAHCDDFIRGFPSGYETLVGERGVKLSGGERQRVAIARAILRNAPILVLDEATSSLDSHSESLIQEALETLMKGKTTIVVAHRLSTIRMMDRIIVLEDGKVLEEGSHAELAAKEGGLYQKLWNLQAGGFIKE